MRELRVSLRFIAPSLGNVRKPFQQRGNSQHYFAFPRNPQSQRVMLLPRGWLVTLRTAAEILCAHQQEVAKIMFVPEVEGNPRPIPEQFFRRYTGPDKFARHEAFFPGDTIVVTCAVPSTIDDAAFLQLMEYAGRYCGMSPGQPKTFGFYEVLSIRPATAARNGAVVRPNEKKDDTLESKEDAFARGITGEGASNNQFLASDQTS